MRFLQNSASTNILLAAVCLAIVAFFAKSYIHQFFDISIAKRRWISDYEKEKDFFEPLRKKMVPETILEEIWIYPWSIVKNFPLLPEDKFARQFHLTEADVFDEMLNNLVQKCNRYIPDNFKYENSLATFEDLAVFLTNLPEINSQ